MLDGPVASQQPLPNPVMFVAEGGVPGDDEVIGEVEGDGNRVRHFPAVLFREDATRHIGSGRRRSEEHTSELQSRLHLVCRLLLEKKKKTILATTHPDNQDSINEYIH